MAKLKFNSGNNRSLVFYFKKRPDTTMRYQVSTTLDYTDDVVIIPSNDVYVAKSDQYVDMTVNSSGLHIKAAGIEFYDPHFLFWVISFPPMGMDIDLTCRL